SSTAATICDARVVPMPEMRRQSSTVQRVSPCSPPCAASSAFAIVSASPPREPWPITSATSSLSPSAAAPWLRSFSRGRSSGDRFFILHFPALYTWRMLGARRWLLSVAIAAAIGNAACGDPPDKEMQQAQGAIDAARAAGADQYAHADFVAAQEALKRAQDAVDQRDYRLALNHALDSRERAQNAVKAAADQKAAARTDA